MTPVEEALSYLAIDEGGVKDVGDGKGVTYWGQTQGWLDQYGLKVPETPEQAMSNWSVWLAKTRLDQIFTTVYDAFPHTVVDYAVHSGSAIAIRCMQSALHVKADGIIGPNTLAVLSKYDLVGRKRLAHEVVAAGLEYEGMLITKYPEKNSKYASGWNNRKARMVRRLA